MCAVIAETGGEHSWTAVESLGRLDLSRRRRRLVPGPGGQWVVRTAAVDWAGSSDARHTGDVGSTWEVIWGKPALRRRCRRPQRVKNTPAAW